MTRIRSLRALGLAALVAAAAPPAVAPSTAWAAALSISADRLSADAETGILVASGHVRVSDGRTVATGDRLVVDTRRGTARLTLGTVISPQGRLSAAEVLLRFNPSRVTHVTARGGARLTLPQATLAAAQIAIGLDEQTVTGSGGVRLAAPPDLRALGTRLEYQRRTRRVTLAGEVSLQNRQGILTGDRLESTDDLRRATLRGRVRGRFADIALEADEATLVAAEQKVVLTGNVRVRQGGQELTGTRVTIFYASRRIVAEGPTRLRLVETPTAP